MKKLKKKIKKCRHRGGKGYWSNLPGALCLACLEEISQKFK